MSILTYHRLLRDNGGSVENALLHAAAVIDYLAGKTSMGFMRASPYAVTMEPKPRVEPLDVPANDSSPHG